MVCSPEAGWRARKNSRASAGITVDHFGPGLSALRRYYFRSRLCTEYGVHVRWSKALLLYDPKTFRIQFFLNNLKTTYTNEVHHNRLCGGPNLFSALLLLTSVLSIMAFSGRLFSWSLRFSLLMNPTSGLVSVHAASSCF